MTPSRKTSICLTLLIVSAVAAGPSSGSSAPAASSMPATSASLYGRFGDSLFFQPGRGPVAGPMLVVPDKEMDAATVGRIIEDLSIMARIIKKNFANVIGFDATTGPYGRTPFTNPYAGPSLLFSSGGQPRPLYVAGYGALFFIQVDFPLVGAEQSTTTEQSETDVVWAEARQSLSEPQPSTRYRRGAFNGPQPYSRERVDALQSSLIATMKHAANIRGLEPTEWLTIAVQGTSSQTDGSASAAGGGTALTLRATKANIDLYAKGELGQPEFEQRLQVVGVPTSLFGQQNAPQASYQPAPAFPQAYETNTDLAALLNATGGRSSGWPWLEQDSRTVFVVPKPDLPLDALAAITEDMTVMCRILDKLMLQAALIVPAPDTLDPFGRATADSYMQPQGLYLDGYGAVFFVEVEFPLAPGPQGQGQPKTEPSADTLWSQTADELKGVAQDQDTAVVQEYDAEKVENLKKVLVKSLRHAANVRMPGTQEQVTVVVMARTGGNSTGSAARFRVEPSASERANVLVFRTAKTDVDAFAKGTLTLEQFTEKVRILPSWTRSRQQAAPSTGLALPSSGSSTNVRR